LLGPLWGTEFRLDKNVCLSIFGPPRFGLCYAERFETTLWPGADKKRMGVPGGHLVFGTYSGSSRTRGFAATTGSRHVIMIYQPALELRYGSDKDQLEQEIRRVVLHELAHHLGMSHPRMKEIGL
jgi:hypothetical protein